MADYLWHLVHGLMPMAEFQSCRYTKKVRGHCCGQINLNCCQSEHIECHIVLFSVGEHTKITWLCKWQLFSSVGFLLTFLCMFGERATESFFLTAYWGWQANNNLLKGYWSLLDIPDPSSSLPPSLFIMRLSLACPLKRNHPTFIWSRPH